MTTLCGVRANCFAIRTGGRRCGMPAAGLIERDHNPTRVTDHLVTAYESLGLLA